MKLSVNLEKIIFWTIIVIFIAFVTPSLIEILGLQDNFLANRLDNIASKIVSFPLVFVTGGEEGGFLILPLFWLSFLVVANLTTIVVSIRNKKLSFKIPVATVILIATFFGIVNISKAREINAQKYRSELMSNVEVDFSHCIKLDDEFGSLTCTLFLTNLQGIISELSDSRETWMNVTFGSKETNDAEYAIGHVEFDNKMIIEGKLEVPITIESRNSLNSSDLYVSHIVLVKLDENYLDTSYEKKF